ncbi:DUF3168 domain-containing protein [Labrenzia sp. PHM005]|uniref:DUF3168 domain-containing protein n=1 Tax=Labrenzia sp. PHM005 TaxID=2590016 RepID=UPI00113FCB28|nr:DUF3168 domain-containing protein [Labrenzia sp. PHM005]QDG78422.1 DUF3168 domain-containing protein [Labrenzia sp. PHM005]
MSLADVQTAVRAGFFSLLAADGVLQNLLGSDRIFETPPRAEAFPYLVLEALETRPLLAEIGEGAVHALSLSVFSRERSRDEAASAAGRAAEVLMNGPIALAGHRLVNLTMTTISSRRLRDGRGYRATSSLRAVTEPLT